MVESSPVDYASNAVVTFTANPSVDKTIVLADALARGEVQRAESADEQAAGKGVNVARVVASSGIPALAVLPFTDAVFVAELEADLPAGMTVRAAGAEFRARTNTTITEPTGVTTKINEPGPLLDATALEAAAAELVDAARGAQWVALSGSLPPGAPTDWYARLVAQLKPLGCRIAVDTSDAALDAVLDGLTEAGFDLIKPNSDELAQLTGGDAAAFEAAAARGEVDEIVAAARTLHARGIANVLVTLGGAGAVLVNAQGAWLASSPKITVRSTVGAGDSSVAGFILADTAGADPASALLRAVTYGSAAASLPGTTLPTRADLSTDGASVTRLA